MVGARLRPQRLGDVVVQATDLLEEIRHFFEVYKALEPAKGTEISHWDNAEVAWQEIRAATERYSSL